MLIPDIKEEASDFIDSLDPKRQNQIWKKIGMLLENPTAGDVKAIVGSDFLRCRAGDYRIIYEVEEDVLRVVLVGNRGNVYELLDRLYP